MVSRWLHTKRWYSGFPGKPVFEETPFTLNNQRPSPSPNHHPAFKRSTLNRGPQKVRLLSSYRDTQPSMDHQITTPKQFSSFPSNDRCHKKKGPKPAECSSRHGPPTPSSPPTPMQGIQHPSSSLLFLAMIGAQGASCMQQQAWATNPHCLPGGTIHCRPSASLHRPTNGL